MKNIIYLLMAVLFSFGSMSCSARQAKKAKLEQNEVNDTLQHDVVKGIVEEEMQPVVEEVVEEVAKVEPKPEPKPVAKPTPAPKVVEKAAVQEVEKTVAAPVKQEVPVVAEPIVLIFPEGSVFPIKLSSTLSTDAMQTGMKFSGVVQMDVISDAGDVIPEGAKVQGKVVSFKHGGRLVGQSELVLELTHIKLGDKYHALTTQQLVMQSEKAGKKTLRNAGVGAAVGAAVDGGSGAGKGAAIMGGVQLLTNKGALKVPAGSALNFTLARDLSFEK